MMSFVHRFSKEKTSIVYTFLVIIYSFLFIYHIGKSSFTIADFFLVSLFFFLMVNFFINKKTFNYVNELLPFIFFVTVHFFLALFLDFDVGKIGSTSRYLFYLVVVFFGARNFFLPSFGVKLYESICVISTVYLIVQTIFFTFFHVLLPGHIQNSYFPVLSNHLNVIEKALSEEWVNVLRPAAFFAEPAHCAEYLLGGLCISLFAIKKIKLSILLTIGVLVSMSSTGILVSIVIWLLWLADFLGKKIRIESLVLFLSILPLMIAFVFTSSFFDHFLTRMKDGESSIGRFNGYYEILQNGLISKFDIFFGSGMDTSIYSSYLAGYARLFVFFGLIGVVCFLVFAIMTFLSKKIVRWQKIMMFVFLILNTGTEILFQPMILCFFSFILCLLDREDITKECLAP